ncbi:MAG: hypothetical protein NC225_03545 [Clostridium sp.]|nr:hypothetical protein [Clostridium sp.]MCM1398541.1 hypothetical protein [Clostridium sp.]MCM1459829.1 hypothetical protein [Bacteroides sp.]
MLRDEMAAEISMRRDIPMEEVEEVLEERDCIVEEECKRKKRKKCIVCTLMMTFFLMGAACALYILDKKEKIDMELTIKKYVDKYTEKLKNLQAQLER